MQILQQTLFYSLGLGFTLIPVENFSFSAVLGTAKLTLPEMAASNQIKMFYFSSGYVNCRKMGLQAVLFSLHP